MGPNPRIMRRKLLPILTWGKDYNGRKCADDLLAACVVMVMLIPQALAYALIAGLPAQMGLYASILPLIVYAFFGSSRALAVGPAAVLSLMTAAALANFQFGSMSEYVTAALTLAFLSGVMLTILGVLRLGFLANFMSHPVVTGFVTSSALIIVLTQVQHLLGISSNGYTLPAVLPSLLASVDDVNIYTTGLSVLSLIWLFWVRRKLPRLLVRMRLSKRSAVTIARMSPIFVVATATACVWYFDLTRFGIVTVGTIPSGLPTLTMPSFSADTWEILARSAALIAIIGFVESVSIAQGLAAKRRERIDPDQELIGLGAANIAASFSGGFPVAGSFSRSGVNYNAGAATPAAGLFAAVLLGIATLYFVQWLTWLPEAVLAATIVSAVWGLLDFSILKKAWKYSFADFLAVSVTIALTLMVGVEIGVASGIFVSIAVHLYKTSRPHVAVVGEMPGTEHFRNEERHDVVTHDTILSLRIDESLYFANTRYLEDVIYGMVAERASLQHVILMCTAVNEVDFSALESILEINKRLDELGIQLHLSEVKGPVMDSLVRTDFLNKLSGNLYLSQHQAVEALK